LISKASQLAYRGRKKGKPPRMAGGKLVPTHNQLLKACMERLDWQGVGYIHIPDVVYKLCAWESVLPIHQKRVIAEWLKGVPDLLVLHEDGTYKQYDVKVGRDKLNAAQRKWAKRTVPIVEVRSVEQFEEEMRAQGTPPHSISARKEGH